MGIRATERLHPEADRLDLCALPDVAAILARGQADAALAPTRSLSEIAAGAGAMSNSLRLGGVLHYLAAGSSGLMAASDAMELGGTFSIPSTQIRIHMAGGLPSGVDMPGDTEDDVKELEAQLADLSACDTVVAVSASGTTPFTLAGVDMARAKGAVIIGIANNAGSALLEKADHAILLETPPEVLAGSTRMGAGTAQKIALNMLSTLMAIDLGHVHRGMMVNLRADNIKLHERARAIVAHAADIPKEQAAQALAQSRGHVKTAVLLAAGAASVGQAEILLEQHAGKLRPALETLK